MFNGASWASSIYYIILWPQETRILLEVVWFITTILEITKLYVVCVCWIVRSYKQNRRNTWALVCLNKAVAIVQPLSFSYTHYFPGKCHCLNNIQNEVMESTVIRSRSSKVRQAWVGVLLHCFLWVLLRVI